MAFLFVFYVLRIGQAVYQVQEGCECSLWLDVGSVYTWSTFEVIAGNNCAKYFHSLTNSPASQPAVFVLLLLLLPTSNHSTHFGFCYGNIPLKIPNQLTIVTNNPLNFSETISLVHITVQCQWIFLVVLTAEKILNTVTESPRLTEALPPK